MPSATQRAAEDDARQQRIEHITTAFEAKRRALAAEFAATTAFTATSSEEHTSRAAAAALTGRPASQSARRWSRTEGRFVLVQQDPAVPQHLPSKPPARTHASIPRLVETLHSVMGRSDADSFAHLLDLLAAAVASPVGFGPGQCACGQATDLGALDSVLTILDTHRAHAGVAASASRALGSLVEGSQRNAAAVVAAGALSNLVALVRNGGADAASGCTALANIAAASASCNAGVCAAGAAAAASNAVSGTATTAAAGLVLHAACGLFGVLCRTPEGVDAVVRGAPAGMEPLRLNSPTPTPTPNVIP